MAEFKTVGDRLTVTGRLDASAEPELTSHGRKLLEGGAETVELDLSRVEQIASVCIGSIVALWIDLRPAGIRLKIIPSPAVKRVLELTGLAGVFARAARPRPPEPAAREAESSIPEQPDAAEAEDSILDELDAAEAQDGVRDEPEDAEQSRPRKKPAAKHADFAADDE